MQLEIPWLQAATALGNMLHFSPGNQPTPAYQALLRLLIGPSSGLLPHHNLHLNSSQKARSLGRGIITAHGAIRVRASTAEKENPGSLAAGSVSRGHGGTIRGMEMEHGGLGNWENGAGGGGRLGKNTRRHSKEKHRTRTRRERTESGLQLNYIRSRPQQRLRHPPDARSLWEM